MAKDKRTLDFRNTYWGHNIELRQKGDLFVGSCISTPRPMEGDHLLWKTEYGHAIAEVRKVEYCRDPMDMCFVEAKVVDRVVN